MSNQKQGIGELNLHNPGIGCAMIEPSVLFTGRHQQGRGMPMLQAMNIAVITSDSCLLVRCQTSKQQICTMQRTHYVDHAAHLLQYIAHMLADIEVLNGGATTADKASPA